MEKWGNILASFELHIHCDNENMSTLRMWSKHLWCPMFIWFQFIFGYRLRNVMKWHCDRSKEYWKIWFKMKFDSNSQRIKKSFVLVSYCAEYFCMFFHPIFQTSELISWQDVFNKWLLIRINETEISQLYINSRWWMQKVRENEMCSHRIVSQTSVNIWKISWFFFFFVFRLWCTQIV